MIEHLRGCVITSVQFSSRMFTHWQTYQKKERRGFIRLFLKSLVFAKIHNNCVDSNSWIGTKLVHKWCIKESYFLWYFLRAFFCMGNKNSAKQEFSFAIRKLGFPYQHVHWFNVSFPHPSTGAKRVVEFSSGGYKIRKIFA